MKNIVMDFDEYAIPSDFRFKGNLYRIPAFDKGQIEKLMKINNQMVEMNKASEIKNEDTEMKTNLDLQDEFLSVALLKEVGENNFIPIEYSEIEVWPLRVKAKVMKTVSDQMSMTIDEEGVSKDTEKKS